MDASERLILASASPRRQEILRLAGIPFEVHPANSEYAPNILSPSERVMALARSKAEQIAPYYPNRVVLGADTMVVLDGVALGKPKSQEHAIEMLTSLQGREHCVMTGVWLIRTDSHGNSVKFNGFTEETRVRLYPLTPVEIKNYVLDGEPMDKAGAYGIQGKGMRFVKEICGDYYNVVGLPAAHLIRFLDDF